MPARSEWLLDCDWSATVSIFPSRADNSNFSQRTANLIPFSEIISNGSWAERGSWHVLHFPLSCSLRKWRQIPGSLSQRRTPNSLKVNETYKRGAPAIHLNPQSNLLSRQRQTSLCALSGVLGITNYGIFCPVYVLLCRHVHSDRISYSGTCPIYWMAEQCSAGVHSVIWVGGEFNAVALHCTACREMGVPFQHSWESLTFK